MEFSPKKYDIDDGIGNYTSSVLDNKIFGYDPETEDIRMMLKEKDVSHSFCDSLRTFLTECGYKGSTEKSKEAEREMRSFICKAYSTLNEENTVSEKTVGRWIRGECRPDNSAKSRESVFQIMFALNADLFQTTNFFLKAYYVQPFNFRNINECIYYWCLKNKRGWDTVKKMKNIIAEKQQTVLESHFFDEQTILIGKALDELTTEDEAVAYIAANISPDEIFFHTAGELFFELLDEAKVLAESTFESLNTQNDITDKNNKKDSIGYRKQKNSVDFLLTVIFGTKEKIKPEKDWEPLIRENFPAKEQFSRCFKGDVSNSDLLRKSLILLMFFITYAENSDTDFDTFCSNVNYHLEECGFPLLYPANPYDRIFLVCAYNGNEEINPIEYFREVFFVD